MKKPLVLAASLLTGLFAFPFVAASATCDWRLNSYALAGLAVLIVVTVMPFVSSGACLVKSRLASALMLAAACVLVWVAGFAAADVRILCRLF